MSRQRKPSPQTIAVLRALLLLDRTGDEVTIHADGDTVLLVLTGEPMDEPIVGYGPFVMNSEAQIREAIDDFNAGRFASAA